MNGIILTQNSFPIIGQVAWLLGKIMEGIFAVLDAIGIPNIGLAIILFTIIVNLLMLPLTVKQQKFAKLSAKMNPEIQAIQAKYKGKKDNDSMMAQNQEIQNLYAKYGVSPTGSCMYLLIQMPILFALYRVIDSMPAYVGKIKNAFFPLVDKIISLGGAPEFIQSLTSSARYANQFTNASYLAGDTTYVQNTLIDCLNKASTADFASIAAAENFPSLATDVANTMNQLEIYNNFLGLNIGNSPWYIISNEFDMIREGVAGASWLVIIGALVIPVLSVLTQWINIKLMPQQNSGSGNEQADSMAQSMKTMNMIMPLFSAYLCFSFPSGMGLYWVAGSVVRSIQQVIINKRFDKMDFEDIIKKNVAQSEKKTAKNAKRMEKIKEQQEKINAYANMNTKNLENMQKKDISRKAKLYTNTEGSDLDVESSSGNSNYQEDADPTSIMAKVNLVNKYNNKNRK
ncbi:MAG: membrane protein insertase YidC [Acetatifactor sp.]|nr:membrane protein insertase YidC [Acetatifactor sp.]